MPWPLQNWHPPTTAVRHLAEESQITPSYQLIRLPMDPLRKGPGLHIQPCGCERGIEWWEGGGDAEATKCLSLLKYLACCEVSLSILSPEQKNLRGNLRCTPRGILSIPDHCMASVCGRRPSLAAGRSKPLDAEICQSRLSLSVWPLKVRRVWDSASQMMKTSCMIRLYKEQEYVSAHMWN